MVQYIISSSGKQKGDVEPIGLKTIKNLKLCSNEYESILEVYNSDFHNANLAELQSWKESDVYIKVLYNGQNLVSVRLVCTLKDLDNKVVPKARLVAKGFEVSNLFERNIKIIDSVNCTK